jgi:wobble nucleotide-excising tRNase
MQKSKINNQRCPTCGKRMTNGAASIPLSLDTRFKRAMTSLTRTLQQIEAEQGRKAAKAALAELNKAINLD